jgi:hypothetical protein
MRVSELKTSKNETMTVTHQQIDARSLELHRLIADKIRADPALFERARATLMRFRRMVDERSQPYLVAWERIFAQGMEATLALATEDSEWAAAMRQSAPFAGILTNQERWAFFQNWWKQHHES